MYLRGCAPVIWRCEDQAQLGVDPGYAQVLNGLSDQDQTFLSHLPIVLTRQHLYRATRSARLSPSRARRLIRLLGERGMLVEGNSPPLSAAGVYRERLGQDAREWAARLARASVTLLGSGPLVLALCRLLLEAGVGSLVVEDLRVVTEIGRQFPGHRVRGPGGGQPDLVVLVGWHVLDPVRERPLAQAGLDHLVVTIGEVSTRVGPVLSDTGPVCRSCLELWECEADACWPAVATQARLLRPAEVDPLILAQAAALAARAVTDYLAGGQAQAAFWGSASVSVDGAHVTGRVRRWRPHPECLCAQTADRLPSA